MRLFLTLGLISGLLLCSAVGLADTVVRLSEPVAQDAHSEVFGRSGLLDGSALSLDTLMNAPEDYLGESVVLQTRIGKVCQKKGCFFIAQAGPTAVRVSFRDYGFFIPTDSGNKTVTMAGELIAVERTPEQAEHFAQDMGGDSVPAGPVYEFVADAVRIPR